MDPDAKQGRQSADPRGSVLPAETQFRDQRPVPLDVVALEVAQQPTALTDKHQETSTAVMILLVDLQVLREMVDAPREERYLHLRRASIGLVEAVLSDRCSGIGHARTEILRLRKRATYHGTPAAGRVGLQGIGCGCIPAPGPIHGPLARLDEFLGGLGIQIGLF